MLYHPIHHSPKQNKTKTMCAYNLYHMYVVNKGQFVGKVNTIVRLVKTSSERCFFFLSRDQRYLFLKEFLP